MIDHDEKAITIEQIQKFVADYYHLKLHELKSRNNSKSVAMPRQVAMYLCKSLTHASLPEIGRSFGGKHHSTVIHSIKKVEEMRKKNGDFDKQVGEPARIVQVTAASQLSRRFPQPACAWIAGSADGAKDPFLTVRTTTDDSQRNAQVK